MTKSRSLCSRRCSPRWRTGISLVNTDSPSRSLSLSFNPPLPPLSTLFPAAYDGRFPLPLFLPYFFTFFLLLFPLRLTCALGAVAIASEKKLIIFLLQHVVLPRASRQVDAHTQPQFTCRCCTAVVSRNWPNPHCFGAVQAHCKFTACSAGWAPRLRSISPQRSKGQRNGGLARQCLLN